MNPEPTAEEHHHRSARERQRSGPMWGCMRWMSGCVIGLAVILLLVIGGGWWYLGTSNFAGLVRLRVQKTLESRLGRHVTVGQVLIERGRLNRIVVNDVRIANAPGGVRPYFGTVRQLVITGGIDSFWGRKIVVDRVDIVDPHLSVEVFPAGSKLVHNFPHWDSGPPSRYEIYHLDLKKMFVTGGVVELLDRRNDLSIITTNLSTSMHATSTEDLYQGIATSPQLQVTIQDYKPFRVALRGEFRYSPNVLDFQSLALEGGPDLRVYLRGRLAPLADGVYNMHVTSQIGLNRVRDIFRINKTLDGTMSIDGTLRGRQGTFTLAGGFAAARLKADAYDLADARGQLNITGDRAIADIASARYGGGTIAAHYQLPQYAEPFPMSVDLRYHGISLEKLFSDWGILDTGLRGGASGTLRYHWEKDRILAGGGEGKATLSRTSSVFSQAKYPIALGGSADFALDRGTITFLPAELATPSSTIQLTGKFRIADSWTDLLFNIHSRDFGELDRIGYNFARSAGKRAYELLGLGGAGAITGNVRGRIQTPEVVAHIVSAATRYNNVLLGDASIDLKYDGARNALTFDHAVFRDGNGRMTLTGAITFPDSGPSPRFDLALDASDYPVERAMAAVNLKLAIKGNATGRMVITGTPDAGRATFAGVTVHQPAGDLRLNGSVAWLPGKGNTQFDLDVTTRDFPVADIVTFLDLGTLPVTGAVSGTLHLQGPKSALGGAGAITIKHGTIYGEPVDAATANILFHQGTLRATDVNVVAPAGTITGNAEFNTSTNQFTYNITSSAIDLSKVKALSALAGLLGGNVTLSSTGAGTVDKPEVVLQATLDQATLRGLNLPAGAPPPKLYLAIRNGELIVKGSVADLITIDGQGAVSTDGALSGLVHVSVKDIARTLAMSPKTSGLPVSGSLTTDLQLGGKLSSIEAVRIDATFPAFNLMISEHTFVPVRPLRVGLRDGRVLFDDFELSLGKGESTFSVAGFMEVTGSKRMKVDLRGTLEAVLLQLFLPDLHAEGHINIAGSVGGTFADPRLSGTAELQKAQMRFAGFPQLIDNITGTLVFHGDRIDIDSLRANLGGGTVVLGGSIALNGLAPKSFRVTMQTQPGSEVAIRYFDGITVEGRFTLVLSGDTERAILQGDVDVTRALYYRDIDIGSSLLTAVLSRKGPTPITSASWQSHIGLRVHLVAADGNLAIRNNVADVTAGGDLELTGTLANPSVLGLVSLDEGGRVKFQTIDYRLVRGSINFQNPFRIDPFFDVTLEARVNGGLSELESGPIDLSVTLTGTIDRMTPTITSDPPASDITLFSLVGLGGLAGRSNGAPQDATGAGKSLLFQSISLLGSKVFSFADSFTIDPSDIAQTGDPGPKVSFAKRLSNQVRVLVVYNTKDSKKRIVLEWQVNPDWLVQTTADELKKEARIEGRFRRRYNGHWTWGSRGRNPLEIPRAGVARVTPGPQVMFPPTTEVAPPLGAQVVSVNLHADSQLDTARFSQYVSVKAHEPLSIRAVQNSVRSLFATGDFRDIRVSSSNVSGGVAITFALYTNYRVTSIRFDGVSNGDRDRAAHELTFHLGDVLSLNAIDHSAVALQSFLNRSGYLEAAVDPETTFSRGEGRAEVIFHVARGTRATVGTVAIDGTLAPFTPADLVHQMKRGPGKAFELLAARSDAERMRTYLIRRDYRKASVQFEKYTYDSASKTVALQYTATSGPVVNVELVGVPRRTIRGVLPFRRNQAYSEDVIDKATNDIVTRLQQRGFYNATADTEEGLNGNVWTTTFRVKPGPQLRLAAVTFSGNQKVADKTLAPMVQTSSSTGFVRSLFSTLFRRATGVTRAQLSSDRDALESYYRLNGFSEVQVAPAVVKTDEANHSMSVDFPIVEGPQTLVTDVRIEGTEQIAVQNLPRPSLKPGAPLDPQKERADVVAIQSFYANRGNVEAQVQPREEISADKTSARITYVVAEGPVSKLGDVVVRGNTYTKPSVVLRTAQLHKNEPFSYTSILEAQRNLYQLGIFQRVDVQAEQTGTSVAERNVSITVEEGKDLSLAGSVGVTSGISGNDTNPSLLGSVSVAHRNLFGTGRYLGLELVGTFNPKRGKVATGGRQEAFLTYREPSIGPFNVPIQVTAFQSDTLRRGAHLRQRGTFIEATRLARYQTRWSLRYEYRISQCIIDKPTGDVCSLLANALLPGYDRTFANIKISSLTPTFFWDRRDDSIDPHRGFFTSSSLEYAFKALNADARFLKEFTQASWYLPVSTRSVFAMSGRVGVIGDLDRGFTSDGLARTGVPLSERFTAGGDTSHRGFPLDLLGITCADPRDAEMCSVDSAGRLRGATLVDIVDSTGKHTIAPIGGKSLFIMNAEYRFPVAGAFGGTLFTDIGNVFDETRIQFGNLRYGIGTGVRYVSPVGPVRFDLGYKLNRRILRFDETGKAIYEKPLAYFITLGYAF